MANQAFGKADDLLFGSGELYIELDDDEDGWKHLGNVDEFVITTTVESIDKNSSMNMKRELLSRATTAISITASATLTEYDYKNLALALFGEAEIISQTETPITNKEYTVSAVPGILTVTNRKGGRYYGIKDVSIAPASAYTKKYTKNIDFIVDEQSCRAGIIKIPEKSKIKKGEKVVVTCTVPEKDLYVVRGGSRKEMKGKLLFVADANSGPNYVIEGWKVHISPEGDLAGLISSGDFGSYSINFAFTADYENHPDDPFYSMVLVDHGIIDSVNGEYDPDY